MSVRRGLGRTPSLGTAAAVAGVALSLAAPGAAAQVVPSDHWRTLATSHFRVHYGPGLEAFARRSAADAERAYAELARELVPPRGIVDLVLADNVDYSNGFATPTPTNRIVVYAHPPVDESTLRYYDRWGQLVITHELTHVFHLDRARGVWALGQHLFGRNPVLFPNEYGPAWLTEGLAVYYESRLTGYGRIAGTAHAAFARAAAAEGRFPSLGALSLATPAFPGGNGVYVYGSLTVDYLARAGGAERVREFVERESAGFAPFEMNHLARRSFGRSFTGAARALADSLGGDAGAASPAIALAGPFYAAGPVRWGGQGPELVLDPGRSTAALYTLRADRPPERGERRSAAGPNVRMPDGSLLFAQVEYTDPYHVRSDLYVERGGRSHRLTRGARLFAPDVRATDGAIVAVRTGAGTTSLVRVSASGRVVPLTAASPDTQWTEPRWSPDGAHLAAARIVRGGGSEIVVLDTAGSVERVLAHSARTESAPAWSADGRLVYFSSDRAGTTEAYVVSADGGAPRRLTRSPGGTANAEPAPGGTTLIGSRLVAGGYEVVAVTTGGDRAVAAPAELPSAGLPAGDSAFAGPSSPYRPWRTLVPRYWMPTLGAIGGRTSLGAYTSASDPVGRHSYLVSASAAPQRMREPEWAASYSYRGLGQPALGAQVAQSWDEPAVFGRSGRVGTLVERQRIARVTATLERPRVRTSSYVTGSLGVERRTYGSEPDSLLRLLGHASYYASRPTYRTAGLYAGWSNAQRPTLSISPEDGVAFSGRVVERWLRAAELPGAATEAAAAVRGYRALDLPGFAHHVLAARVAGGVRGPGSTDTFDAGGTSGSSLDLLPGYSLGGAGREFGVRGFPAGAQSGTRAAAASAEYRAPLLLPERGVGLLPVFFSKLSAAAFSDAGAAWCPARGTEAACGASPVARRVMSSVGAELDLDAGLGFDQLFRLRAGVAVPVAARDLAARRASVYATFGLAY